MVASAGQRGIMRCPWEEKAVKRDELVKLIARPDGPLAIFALLLVRKGVVSKEEMLDVLREAEAEMIRDEKGDISATIFQSMSRLITSSTEPVPVESVGEPEDPLH
jgi:hypothetical protein